MEIVLDAEKLERVAAIAVDEFALEFSEAGELDGDVGSVGENGEDGDDQAEVEAARRSLLRGRRVLHSGKDITRVRVEPTRRSGGPPGEWYTFRALGIAQEKRLA